MVVIELPGVLSKWLRAVRVPLLAASVISVSSGLTIAWAELHVFNAFYAFLTFMGVICAHASIDLLNDYSDYKSNIDLITKRTPLSGGTGVLPEGLLQPRSVYRAGILLLVAGAVIGLLLAFERGWLVGVFLLFGIVAVYFYSTHIANVGLGEGFIVLKGTLIVLGTYFVQALSIAVAPIFVGLIMGLLSSSALYVNEFPDYEADRLCGRRNLIVRVGRERAAKLYVLYPILVFTMIFSGILTRLLPLQSAVTFVAVPFFWRASRTLTKSNFEEPVSQLIPAMTQNVVGARIVGLLIVLSYILPV